MKRQTTIHDIANYLNISASTVSRALSDHPRISEPTKMLVRKAAADLNYRPNKLASNLRRGSGNTIGVILPVINRYFFANIIHGMEQVAASKQYSLIICQSNETLKNEISAIQTLIKNRVDGILISASSESRDTGHFESLRNSQIPYVLFDRALNEPSVSRVVNDDFLGAYRATEHLIREGYRRILHFSGPIHLDTYKKRHDGYQKALIDNGLAYDPDRVEENVISREKGASVLASLVKKDMKFDAIFAASDLSALGALLELKKHQIDVPGQIGLVGYVNEPFAEFIEPSLTSIEQYGEEIGTQAARLLIEKIADPAGEIRTVSIRPDLIIRDSSVRRPDRDSPVINTAK